MRFFIGSYIYDIILLILCGVVFKTFILKKGLSEKESFFIRHTLPIIYIPLSVLLIVNMVYIVLIDREIIDNTYKGFALYSLSFIWIIMVIIGFYNRIKYGSKDWEYVEETKRGIFGLIGLFVMAIFMYLFI